MVADGPEVLLAPNRVFKLARRKRKCQQPKVGNFSSVGGRDDGAQAV
ncbi:hypothetical protein HMPREF9440_01763 [Sutterella parvirubra YIT 11816]|uniref:Uncharacterized protein n=1 Tax=Sutterella parvirubra YIT 11816 TaxID=762967 RepID=H3KG84_9BURK|nr:hypothetical protein HMPREF9440_01763 [Sutterella parvirubra YIT 11816]